MYFWHHNYAELLQYPEKDLPFSVESIFPKTKPELFSFDQNEILKLKALLNCASLIPFIKQLDLMGKTGYKLETEGARYSGQPPINVVTPKPSSSSRNVSFNVHETDDSDENNMSSLISLNFKYLENPKVALEASPKIEPIVISSDGENSSDSESFQSVSLVNKERLIVDSDRSENSENEDEDMRNFINDDKEGLLEELTPKKHSDSCECKLCENSPVVNQIYQNYLKSKLLQLRQKNVAMKSKAKKRRSQFESDSD